MKTRVIYSMLGLLLCCQFGMAQVAPEEHTKEGNKLVFKTDNNLTSTGILLGVHGARETMFEVGFFTVKWFGDGENSNIGAGFLLSTEHYINKDYVIAPKVGAFTNLWGVHLGLNGVWYLGMEDEESVRFRPEIGYGNGRFKVTYGLNMAISNKDMPNVSKHMLSFVYFFNFNKKANRVLPKFY